MCAAAIWFTGPGQAKIAYESEHAPGEGEVQVRTLASGLSRGTESLVFQGLVPESEWQRMRAPLMGGAFPFPVKYGYAAVGTVVAGPAALLQRTVFCLHPHQDVFTVDREAVVPVPADVPPERAVLAANMETALNGLWDAGAGPGDRIAVVGAGVVGALVAYLADRLPGADVTLIDIDAGRAALAERLGVAFAVAEDAPDDCDLVIHASGAPDGLATALACAGLEATVLEMSWYGARPVAVPLGGAFHARRLRLISSQVGQVSPGHRPRWSYKRRLAKALDLLADPALDALLAPAIDFADVPAAIPRILAPGSGVLCQVIRYPAVDAADDTAAPA